MKISVLFGLALLFALANCVPFADYVAGNLSLNVYGVYSGSSPYPGSRRNSANFYDRVGNYWMFGGYGCGESSIGELNDMWKWDVTASKWHYIGGSKNPGGSVLYSGESMTSTQWPNGRDGAAGWYDSTDEVFIMFGGNAGNYFQNDVWVWNFTTWAIKTQCCCGPRCGNFSSRFPGPVSISADVPFPGARAYSSAWMDNRGNVLLFGGYGFDGASKLGELNDLWIMKISTGVWTFVGGNTTCNAPSVDTSKYQWPSGRDSAVSWYDPTSGVWYMFGGYNQGGSLNDMWKVIPLCPRCNFSIIRPPVSIGSAVGDLATTEWPSPRFGSASWKSGTNNVMFGGYDDTGFLNDMWAWNSSSPYMYRLSAGTLTPTGSWPNARYYSVGWQDPSGNYYLFSGYGSYGAESGEMNDLWKLVA